MKTEEFIEKAKEIHGDKYDYSKVNYINSKTKVCIICPEHGEFWMRPDNHLMGKGCKECSVGARIKYNVNSFIKKAKEVHGDKYDYSKVNYVDLLTKVCIICPEHGEFWQSPKNHLNGYGCSKCGLKRKSEQTKYSLEEFIEKAKQIHGDKYDYSKVNYINAHTKVCIICPEHGEFWQRPSSHLIGDGCPSCSKLERTLTQEEYIKRAKEVHVDRYDYSKVQYKNMYTKICVICPKHGEFLVEANNHLNGCGCKECFKNDLRKPFDEFIKKACKVHGDKYDYSKVEYVNNKTKVCIICPEHGEFWQTPGHHLNGHGCPSCAGNNRHTNISFIEKAKEIHGDKYDYSKVEYINTSTKICIICPEHGEFWITPNNHLRGEGCPKCKKSKLESIIEQFLDENKIKYVYNCNSSYLDFLKKQHLDFYLPDYNIAIECQGEQHYYPVDFAGKGKEWAQKKYEQIKILDKNKKKICTKYKIKLIYFGAKRYRKNVLTNINDILDIINGL